MTWNMSVKTLWQTLASPRTRRDAGGFERYLLPSSHAGERTGETEKSPKICTHAFSDLVALSSFRNDWSLIDCCYFLGTLPGRKQTMPPSPLFYFLVPGAKNRGKSPSKNGNQFISCLCPSILDSLWFFTPFSPLPILQSRTHGHSSRAGWQQDPYMKACSMRAPAF